MKSSILLFIVIVFNSCINESKYEEKEKRISILNENFMNSYGVYSLNENDNISKKQFRELADKFLFGYSEFKNRNERRNRLGYYIEEINVLEGVLTPPEVSYLNSYGKELSVLEQKNVQKCTSIFTITFYGSNKEALKEQRNIQEFIYRLIEGRDVVIADFGTLEYFNSNSWEKYRVQNFRDIPENVMDQVLVNLSSNNKGNCRAVTFGMEKFCLPDISIDNFLCLEKKKYSDLLIAVTQTLVGHPEIHNDSTITIGLGDIKNKRWNNYFKDVRKEKDLKINLKLKLITPKLGDKNNKQFLIVHNDQNSSDAEKKVNQLFITKDVISYARHDEQLLNVSSKARERLPELKNIFNSKQGDEISILLKAPFTTSKNTKEWIWVRIIEWNDQSIRGALYNTPINIPDFKEGVMVSILESDVFDYIYKKPDGTIEGNETEKLILSGTTIK